MSLYLLEYFIFNDDSELLFHCDFTDTPPPDESAVRRFENRAKTLFGIIAALCDIVARLGEAESAFSEYATDTYKLSCHRTATRLYFVLATRPDSRNHAAALRRFHETVFLDRALASRAREFFAQMLRAG